MVEFRDGIFQVDPLEAGPLRQRPPVFGLGVGDAGFLVDDRIPLRPSRPVGPPSPADNALTSQLAPQTPPGS
jgi:hypothetical protein